MTQEQLDHYLNGGYFTGIYKPTKMDIDAHSKIHIGRVIEIYPNIDITPILNSMNPYVGQFRLNSPSVSGWFPEEDIQRLKINPDEFKDNPTPIPQYLYRLFYTKQEQVNENFGINHNLKVPFHVARSYDNEMDDYVLELSSPQATCIEKAIWRGELINDIHWTKLL